MARDFRMDAVQIFNAAVEAVQPEHFIPKNVRREGSTLHIGHLKFDLQKYSDVVVVGGGKASAAMALPMEAILGRYLSGGLVVTKYGHSAPLKKIRVHEGGHPVPDESGVRGTAELIRAVEPLGQETLALCLLSGGGSALLSSFEDDITLEDAQALSRLLLSGGVRIHEINTIRKHISQVGGGKLARLAHPATLITLVLSDVIGDSLESIASGPTVPDPSTFVDATQILARHSLEKKLPASIRDFFSRGVSGEVPETPKPGDAVFSRCQTLVVGNNSIALDAAEKKAASLGYDVGVTTTQVEGESREVARAFARRSKELQSKKSGRRKPECLLMGGETTVTIQGTGVGGRNQEFALSAALEIEGSKGVVILSGGTDGTDGPTDVAGAVVDGSTCGRARQMKIVPEKFLDDNDSYNFFRRVEGHLLTGPTRTNVMDVMVALIA